MRILLTGTRAPATLDLARRLWREGCTVFGADSMRFPVGKFSRAFAEHRRLPAPRQHFTNFTDRLTSLIHEWQIDLVWPTCEEIFYVATAREALLSHASLFCDPMAVLAPLHHKGLFVALVNDLGHEVMAPISWPAADAPNGPELVWKPYFSRFAARTRFDAPPRDPGNWLAQEKVVGSEFCSWTLALNGEVHVTTFYRSTARAGRGAGCAFEPMWSELAASFIKTLVRRHSLTGCFAFDFILSDRGPLYVIECNPRMTSGLHVLDSSVPIRSLLERPTRLPPRMVPAQLWLPVWLTSRSQAGTSPDVISARDDPHPSWNQAWGIMEFALRALRRRVSLLEASTWDIEYNGAL